MQVANGSAPREVTGRLRDSPVGVSRGSGDPLVEDTDGGAGVEMADGARLHARQIADGAGNGSRQVSGGAGDDLVEVDDAARGTTAEGRFGAVH